MTVHYSGTIPGDDGSSLLVNIATVPGPVVDPPPPPPPPPVTSGARRRVLWHHGWHGPRIPSWPVDIPASVSDVVLAMCQSAAPGTGRLTDPPGVSRNDVLGLAAAHVATHVGIGGSDDGGIRVTNEAQATQLAESVKAMRTSFGIVGARWDLETAPGETWNVDAVLSASRKMVAAGLRVGIWSALYGGRLEAWGAVARGLGTDLECWERGFYDFDEANDSRLSGIVTRNLQTMRAYVQRDDQLVASFAPVGSTSRTPVPIMGAAYYAARRTIRPGTSTAMSDVGWSVWEDLQDSAAGWSSTRALAKL